MGRGKRMQTYSLPSTPWVQVHLGAPLCHGHPGMETAMQTGYDWTVWLCGGRDRGLSRGQGLVQGLQTMATSSRSGCGISFAGKQDLRQALGGLSVPCSATQSVSLRAGFWLRMH
jgi:hypothetical protein